jgi:EAL domain-containing protein (putative c-di-GMP-specific phosphodiesterase class I)
MAEETGLVTGLGDWVVREACRQLSAWEGVSGGEDVALTVNVSSRQFAQADLVERVAAALRDTKVAPRRLRVEITESLIVENPEVAAEMLDSLHRLGCGVCLDDFGTGYSSLSYLLRLPIHTLKIDRSFLGDLASGSRNSEIVWAVIVLGQRLGMEVIAEGIETQSQLDHLIELGCSLGQGFLFSAPLDAAAAEAALAAGALEPLSTSPAP